MRFFLAALLAVAFHVSAYGQQSKEEQLAALLAQAAALLAEIEAERESEADAQPAVSQECSHNNIETCDAETLCARATTGSPSTWRTSGVWRKYSDVAKRRGLTCGVVEQPTSNSISSISQCTLSGVGACSTEQLCARGTIGLPKQWRTNGSRLPYAEEAQRRGLTCGVGEQGAAGTNSGTGNCTSRNLSACAARELCERATFGYPKQWYTAGFRSRYAEEAQRRDITCGVVEQVVSTTNNGSNSLCSWNNVVSCSIEQLCDRGTFGTPLRWYERSSSSVYADEAKRRGQTCGVVEPAAPTSSTSSSNQCSSTNARACTVQQLCERATYGSPKRWFTGRHETEAKRRGLTCGVVEQAAMTPRRSDEELCAGGTYGNPKRWAVGGTSGWFADEARRRGLTCGVGEQTTATTGNTSTDILCSLNNVRACSTEQLCERGTFGTPLRWYERSNLSGFSNEAKRRGLTCGVGERAATTSNQCSLNNVRACSTEQLCERGTFGTPLRWYERSNLSGFSNEAKRRGLTCGVGERATTTTVSSSSSSNQCSPTNAAGCTIDQLCSRAAYGEPKQWRKWGVLQNYADEAKRRGLTCGVGERAATTNNTSTSNQCSSTNARACTVQQLCERATYGSPKRWFTGRHETEAKRRGLTCGVVEQTTQQTARRSAASYGEHGPACASYGFTPGTDGFSACIQRETIESENEKRRQEELRVAEARREQAAIADAFSTFFERLGESSRNRRSGICTGSVYGNSWSSYCF